MRKLIAPDGIETIGILLHTFSHNLESETNAPIMAKYGFGNVDPTQWYPVKMLLDALNEIAQTGGNLSNIIAIGIKIGEATIFPPEIGTPTLEKVLMIWDDLYQALHRGGEVGHVRAEKISDKHFKTIHTDLYPDDMAYGVLYAFGRRFLPPGTPFKVYFDPNIKPRDHGGTHGMTVWHIEWT